MFAKAFFLLPCCAHEERKTFVGIDGSKSQEFLNWRADSSVFFVSFPPLRNSLQMFSFCSKYFSYIYSNMRLFVSDSNSLLSDLHPLKISNSLSTTLTQLHRQRREGWVSILSLLKVDATTYLDITRNGRVIRRVRERQKTLDSKDLSPSITEKKAFLLRCAGCYEQS